MPIVGALLSIILGFIELVVGLRVVFKFFGLNGFALVDLAYNWSAPFVQPFARFVSEMTFGTFVLDLPAILALLVYGVIGGLLIRVFRGR